MSRVYGYTIALIGILVLLISVQPVKDYLSRQPTSAFVANIPNTVFMIIGVIIMFIAFFMLKKSGGKQPSEVPIYHGRNIVGFRRLGKK